MILLRVCVSSSATVSASAESWARSWRGVACRAVDAFWLADRWCCFVLARLWIGEESCE